MEKLPKEAINKIMFFLSHPVAEIFKKELEEAAERCQEDYCDCCVSLWTECDCICSNCYGSYRVCRYSCYCSNCNVMYSRCYHQCYNN